MPNIDEKVVQMQFDNSEFDPNIKKSQKTFEEFEKSLEFKNGSKALQNFEKNLSDIDVKGISKNLGTLGKAFSSFETVVKGALTAAGFRIESFINRTLNMALADGIRYGWAAYADTVIATQTIMAATRNQFSDTAKQINYVTTELEELRTFADETSYSFRDMTDNVGKFTSQGLGLDVAVSAMEGISNWASLSGATVAQASRAMYNLSQSLGMGYVMIRDWMSIENANMATVEFKQTVIDTAVALGKLKKEGDVVKTLDGVAVSYSNFRDTLDKKWLTNDVLMQSLNKYGGFSQKLLRLLNEGAFSESELTVRKMLKYIDQYNAGQLNIEEVAKENSIAAEELEKALKELGSEEYELGRRAFLASQETKTFSEAINYLKQTLQTGWAKTFEYIFGTYSEAKEFWTDVSDLLYEVFIVSAEIRNEAFKLWHDNGGRDDFVTGLKEIVRYFKDISKVVNDAWKAIFPFWDNSTEIAKYLRAITLRFRQFAESLKLTGDQEAAIKSLTTAVGNGLKFIWQLVQGIYRLIAPSVRYTKQLFTTITKLISPLANGASEALEFADSVDAIQVAFLTLGAAIAAPIKILNKFIEWIIDLNKNTLPQLEKKFEEWWEDVKKAFSNFGSNFKALGENVVIGFRQGILSGMGSLLETTFGVFSAVLNLIKDIFGIHSPAKETSELGEYSDEGYAEGTVRGKKDIIKAVDKVYGDVSDEIKDVTEDGIKDAAAGAEAAAKKSFEAPVQNIMGKIFGMAQGISSGILSPVKNELKSLGEALDEKFPNKVDKWSYALEQLGNVLEWLLNRILTFILVWEVIKGTKALLQGAAAVYTAIIGVIQAIGRIPNMVPNFFASLQGFIADAGKTMKIYAEQKFKADIIKSIGIMVLLIAASIAIIAGAFIVLAKIDMPNLWKAVAVMGGILVALTTLIFIFAVIQKKFGDAGSSNIFSLGNKKGSWMEKLGLTLKSTSKQANTMSNGIKNFATSILLVSISMGILIGALAGLAKAFDKENMTAGKIALLGGTIIAISAVLVGTVAVLAVINKYIGKTAKMNMFNIITALAGFYFVITILTDNINKIKDLAADNNVVKIFKELITLYLSVMAALVIFAKVLDSREMTDAAGTLTGQKKGSFIGMLLGVDSRNKGVNALNALTSMGTTFMLISAGILHILAAIHPEQLKNAATTFAILGGVIVAMAGFMTLLAWLMSKAIITPKGIGLLALILGGVVTTLLAFTAGILAVGPGIKMAIGAIELLLAFIEKLSASIGMHLANMAKFLVLCTAIFMASVILSAAGLGFLVVVAVLTLAAFTISLFGVSFVVAAGAIWLSSWMINKAADQIAKAVENLIKIFGRFEIIPVMWMMSILGLGLVVLGAGMIVAAAGLTAIAGAASVVSSSLEHIKKVIDFLLSDVDWWQVTKVLGILSLGLLAIGLVTTLTAPGILALASAMFIVAGAVYVFCAATVYAENVVKFLNLVLEWLYNSLDTIKSILYALAPAFTVCGIGLAVFGVGLVLVGIGLTLIAAATLALIVNFGLAIVVVLIFKAILDKLKDDNPELYDSIMTIVKGIIKFIAVIIGLAYGIYKVFSYVWQRIQEFVKWVREKVEAVKQIGYEVVRNFISGIYGLRGKIRQAAENSGDAFLIGLCDIFGIKHGESAVMAENAEDIIKGFTNGVEEHNKDVAQAAEDTGNTFVDSICELLGIHSPSLEMDRVGGSTVDGFVFRIMDELPSVKAAGERMAESFTTGFTNVMKKAGWIESDEITAYRKRFDELDKKLKKKGGNLTKSEWGEYYDLQSKLVAANTAAYTSEKADAIKAAEKEAYYQRKNAQTLKGAAGNIITDVKSIWGAVTTGEITIGQAFSSLWQTLKDNGGTYLGTLVGNLKDKLFGSNGLFSDLSDLLKSPFADLDLSSLIKPINIEDIVKPYNPETPTFDDITNNAAGQGTINTYEFVQNNYSPKALSRIEIYRQTNRQFNNFRTKEVLAR